jgi:2-polyprenyl-6-methoxyphenol hydroxylase-like FAD-dependent oxidoreductase
MTKAQRILIVGAGIAGLALAAALRQRGMVADVIERAAAPAVGGAGLYIVGAGTRALRELGVAESSLREHHVINTQTFLDHHGARLAEVKVDRFWSACGPCIGVARTVLHRALGDNAAIQVRFNTIVHSLQQEADHVAVRFGDGSAAVYDVVVGADGIRSSVRRLVGGAAEPRFRGQMGWRFIVACPAQISGWTVFLGAARAFLMVPIGGGRAYCYADRGSADVIDDAREGRLERLQHLFEDFAAPVRDALAGVDSPDAIHCAPIEDVAYEPANHGRVVLIGDAAHAMSPNMACGVAMALEDALVLADTLHRNADTSQIAADFFRRRHARIEWVRLQTDKRDRLRGLPAFARNLSLRLFASRIYRSNYQPLQGEAQ